MGRRELGKYGESLAVAELRKRGYRILERNYRCRIGEIDVVAQQGGDIVFVEVKTRSSGAFAEPQESVTATKARRLSALGLSYLAERGLGESPWRIDVVSVDLGNHMRPEIQIIPDAVQD